MLRDRQPGRICSARVASCRPSRAGATIRATDPNEERAVIRRTTPALRFPALWFPALWFPAQWFPALWFVVTLSTVGCRQYFEERELEARAAKCGSEVHWAADWAEASSRAQREGKFVLVTFQNYPGFEVDDLAASGPFMDEEIVALTNERFVPLRFRLGMEAPFVDPKVYGIGESAFGVALLITRPDGTVVAETFSFDSPVVIAFLKRVIESTGGAPVTSEVALDVTPTEREAMRLALEGDLESARRTLAPVASATPRARYLDAMFHFAAGERDAAIERLRAIALEEPETRWSWLAAANVTNPMLGGVEIIDLAAPTAEAIEEGMPLVAQPVAIGEAARARREAIEWLLTRQSEDGAWTDPHRIATASGVEHTDLSLATIALGGLALLGEARLAENADAAEFRERLREAAGRALHCLVENTPQSSEDAVLMDYSVWSNPYTLRFAVECERDGVGDAVAARTLADRCLGALIGRQKGGGGWSYYLAGTVEESADPINLSMSFTTACVLDALQRAREFGIAIPSDVESRAIECLLDMRGEDGRFCYLELHTLGFRSGGTSGDAAGRGPACVLPSLRVERLTRDDLLLAVERFVEHLPVLSREQGKVLMHCGPEAEGSHYLLFDYLNAAVSLAALPDADRARLRDPIATAILEARNADGSFVDNPGIGRAAGSALAVLALQAIVSAGDGS